MCTNNNLIPVHNSNNNFLQESNLDSTRPAQWAALPETGMIDHINVQENYRELRRRVPLPALLEYLKAAYLPT